MAYVLRFDRILPLAAITVTTVITYVLSIYSTCGDPELYSEYYNGLHGHGFVDGFSYYRRSIGGIEPVYYIVTWASSLALEKIYYDIVLNCLLNMLLIKYLVRRGVYWLISIMVLESLYVFVILFSAERLRLGAIFFLLALSSPPRYRSFALILSMLSHIQMVVPAFVAALTIYKQRRHCVIYIAFGAIVAFIMLSIMQINVSEYFLRKAAFYFRENNIYESAVKASIIGVLIIVYARSDILISRIVAILFIALCLVFGSNRILMMEYFYFLHSALVVNRGLNYGVFFSLLYYDIKTTQLITNLFMFGSFFPDGEHKSLLLMRSLLALVG